MSRRVSPPIELLEWAVKSRNQKAVRTLLLIKCTEGYRFSGESFVKKHLERLLELNLVGFHHGMYCQRSWEEIMRIAGITSATFVKLTMGMLLHYKFDDLCYKAVAQYNQRLQEDGGTRSGNPRKGRHMHPSVHIGGIAHSLMARAFGRSIHWSQLRRQSCQRAGLLRFTRRKMRMADLPQWYEVPRSAVGYAMVDITSAMEVVAPLTLFVPKWLRKRMRRRVFDVKEGAYVFG